jgi:class 3 adenylate cyclase
MEWIVKRIMTAFAAAAFLTTGVAASAQAAEPGAAAICSAVAEEHREVWAQPAVGASVGGVVAGRTYDADCALVPGGTYTVCGETTSQWARVNYSGDAWGYVPSSCLTWAS